MEQDLLMAAVRKRAVPKRSGRPSGAKKVRGRTVRKSARPLRSQARPKDLNTVRPSGRSSVVDAEFWDVRHRTEMSGQVVAHFGDLSGPAVEFIRSAESVVGCVAWLTAKPILDALARVPGGVSFCVQKENNLRAGGDAWSKELRRRYRTLPAGPLRRSLPDPVGGTAGSSRLSPVRCVGYAGGGQHQPRMHHKFMVAGHMEKKLWVPDRVWTGSFNFSANAALSIENAVVVNDPRVAAGYLAEFARVAAISEPLAWVSRLAKPDLKRR